MRVVPCNLRRASEYVAALHRHHQPPRGGIFAVACADADGVVHGVAVVGRPVARMLDDGQTVEVTRVATDGAPNACSCLYGACFRAARALGFARIYTYTRTDEYGASLRASGWLPDGTVRGRSWDTPSRPREDHTEVIGRQRWVKHLNDRIDTSWPHGAEAAAERLF